MYVFSAASRGISPGAAGGGGDVILFYNTRDWNMLLLQGRLDATVCYRTRRPAGPGLATAKQQKRAIKYFGKYFHFLVGIQN